MIGWFLILTGTTVYCSEILRFVRRIAEQTLGSVLLLLLVKLLTIASDRLLKFFVSNKSLLIRDEQHMRTEVLDKTRERGRPLTF